MCLSLLHITSLKQSAAKRSGSSLHCEKKKKEEKEEEEKKKLFCFLAAGLDSV